MNKLWGLIALLLSFAPSTAAQETEQTFAEAVNVVMAPISKVVSDFV